MVYAKPALNRSLKARFPVTRTANSGPAEVFFCPQKGTRYLDPKTSLWLSADPVNDEIREQNENPPGMGGVFNVVNMHTYHYTGNNSVKYTDPDGRKPPNHNEISYNEVNATFKNWLDKCDPKYYQVARDVKVWLEDQATMGRRPSEAEFTKTAEDALLGQIIYAAAGAVALALTQMPVKETKTRSLTVQPKAQTIKQAFARMGSFTGKSTIEAKRILVANGFRQVGARSSEGYTTFRGPIVENVQLQVTIKPTGQVTRSSAGTGQRFDAVGNRVPHESGEYLRGNYSGNH
jgi:hypothetical protein